MNLIPNPGNSSRVQLMSTSRVLRLCGIIVVTISLPFVLLHLRAAPDDAVISPMQRFAAALANFAGPWGVALVRLVDFPNAGLRSFSWILGLAMTLLGILLFVLVCKMRATGWQVLLTVLWGLFVLAWFGVGFTQIADGLL
jgi:hypothetical protein